MDLPSRDAGLIHMAITGGHREDYQRVLSIVFNLEPSHGRVTARNFMALVQVKSLLFGSLDDDVLGFFTISFVRAVAGRKTVGLFLRPQSCFAPHGWKAAVKHAVFRYLYRRSLVSVCTILPFDIEPKYQGIARHGLADPQLWDRAVLPFDPSREFAEELRCIAKGRRIMAFIGTASSFKGVNQICQIMAHSDWDDSVCVIFAGRIPDKGSQITQELAELGAVLFPRFMSNSELDALYDVADFIWAAYEPDYDQASGNFGRAIQAGKVPIVREGTLIERLALLAGYPVTAINFNDLPSAVARLQGPLPQSNGPPSDQINTWMVKFVEAIKGAL